MLSTFNLAAIVVGPALAGLISTFAGPGWVIGIDAASFAVLAVSCVTATGSARRDRAAHSPQAEPPDRAGAVAGGWRTVLARAATARPARRHLRLLLPVRTGRGRPAHATWPRTSTAPRRCSAPTGRRSASGRYAGGLSAGLLRDRRLSTVVVAIVVGWGAALLPIALTHAVWAGLVGLAIGGLIYGPFTAICVALFQRISPPHALTRVLATRTALTIPSTALGTLVGGPVVSTIGAQAHAAALRRAHHHARRRHRRRAPGSPVPNQVSFEDRRHGGCLASEIGPITTRSRRTIMASREEGERRRPKAATDKLRRVHRQEEAQRDEGTRQGDSKAEAAQQRERGGCGGRPGGEDRRASTSPTA